MTPNTVESLTLTNSDRPNRNVNIRIDLASIRHNLKCARARAPSSKVIAVVKADAYGHGMLRVMPALADADAFAVATTDEAMALRRSGETKPVMVLQGFRTEQQVRDCIDAKLWPVVHDNFQLQMLAGQPVAGLSCWVKFDTGMGRLGFWPRESSAVHASLKAANINVVGIMSHLACADSPGDLSNSRQLRDFLSINWPEPTSRSLANSAGLLSRKDVQLDWVRPGIMLYGASPFENAEAEKLSLQPAMRVTAPVIAVRSLERGQLVGYGGRYQCERATRVAVVGAGYGDGYPREVPDLTSVMFGNRRCPLIGRISMDSMVVDISDLTVPPPIDYPVTLWGHSQLRVDEIASRTGTIAYELVCRIRGERQWIDATNEVNVRKMNQAQPTN